MTKVTTAHLEARKASILDAALRVFARKGLQSATMAEIADDAGISAGAIYRYFNGKDALIEACFESNVAEMTAEWHRQVESTPNPMAALLAISQSSFDYMAAPEANDVTRVMVERVLEGSRDASDEWKAEALAEREQIVRGLMEPLVRARDLGMFPKEIDLYQLAQSMLSFYYGARLARLLGPEMDTRAQLDAFCSLLGIASAVEMARTGTEPPA